MIRWIGGQTHVVYGHQVVVESVHVPRSPYGETISFRTSTVEGTVSISHTPSGTPIPIRRWHLIVPLWIFYFHRFESVVVEFPRKQRDGEGRRIEDTVLSD